MDFPSKRSQVKVLEEANPIVAAASGGNENPLAFLGQLFGNPGMPMPIGVPAMGAVPPVCNPVKQSLFEGEAGLALFLVEATVTL